LTPLVGKALSSVLFFVQEREVFPVQVSIALIYHKFHEQEVSTIMKSTSLALTAFVAQALTTPFVAAFTPSTPTFVVSRSHVAVSVSSSYHHHAAAAASRNTASFRLNMSSFLGMDEDDEDEDDDEDDEDDELELSSSRYSGVKSPFTGMKMDPNDPNPLIKPRPSRIFKSDPAFPVVPDDQLVQPMSQDERKENLAVMRQIRKSDLPDLRMRKDHAGWVEANNDMKKRYNRDPWFGINERLRDAVQLGDPQETIELLQALANKVGGPPPGIELTDRGYAVHTEIYGIGLSPSRAASAIEQEVRAQRSASGRAMMQERRQNQDKEKIQYEEDMRNPGLRDEKEAKERRERVNRKIIAEIEEDNKKKRERAKELLGKLPDTPSSRTASMAKALKEAKDEVKELRRKALGRSEPGQLAGSRTGDGGVTADDQLTTPSEKSSADKAREAAATEASGGRPRLPGDPDVTRGEVDKNTIPVEPSSTTITGPLQVQVSSVYNKEESDPPMRKHCFKYTIKITNNSPTDTIQLLGRRFEIQTVGSSMKDVVQGEGVTGRTPVLKPGEVFEYTSTAPLSVRPIGTTIIAARMRGAYRYITLSADQDTATAEQISAGGDATADLGTFHFIFPDDQRVQPFRADTEDDEEEEEDDEEETSVGAAAAKASTATVPATTPSAAKASTLPGDQDMTSGVLSVPLNDSAEVVTDQVKVKVTSSYRPERSDSSLDKHCFAYNIRITNESKQPIQLVSRRFEIQTVGSANKDVVQGPGVTGRQPILKPGESFEYTSTAPLSVKPLLDKTPAVARMQGEYNFVVLGDDGSTPLSSSPLQAKMGMFHFVLPALAS
jgi:ApaG protein